MDEIAFGRGFRALRIRKALTQDELSARAGVSRGVIARIEQGHGASVTIATLDRVTAALGARVLVKFLWHGDGLDRLLDARHAATVDRVVRSLSATGWQVATEVSFNEYGERGSIDVLAVHPRTGCLLVVEVKTSIVDVQQLHSALDRKVRLGPKVARDRGWRSGPTSVLLVLVESRTNRLHVDRLGATFGAAFPFRTVAVRRWLAAPDPNRRLRGLWFLKSESQAVVVQRVRHPRQAPTHEESGHL